MTLSLILARSFLKIGFRKRSVELDEYVEKILNKKLNTFYEDCYVEGENIAKTYLLMGAIYKKEFHDTELEGDDIF